MPKKILLAEKSDAIRSIAESILHQNGYDVISASGAEKAKELIVTARPNLMIIGADLSDSDGAFLYDSIEDNPLASSIPLLLIADPQGKSVPFPDEVIIPRPFDPKDFIERVRLFVGGGNEQPKEGKVQVTEPFAIGNIDDEFLDAALGIDSIHVEASEDMDRTFSTGKVKIPADSEKRDSFGIHNPAFDEQKKKEDSQKVESLMIREESAKKPASEQSATGKIEIAADQYGIVVPEQHHTEEHRNAMHDYDWFLKEMQKETSNIEFSKAPTPEKMEIKPTSDGIEPIMHPDMPVSEEPIAASATEKEPEIRPGGVDDFIAEFKKEISQISAAPPSDTPSEKTATDIAIATPTTDAKREELSAIESAEARHFASYLAELLAEKLAKRIMDKIDPDEIYRLIKDDFAQMLSEKK
jgi:DNA-binding response OmpR family regulator